MSESSSDSERPVAPSDEDEEESRRDDGEPVERGRRRRRVRVKRPARDGFVWPRWLRALHQNLEPVLAALLAVIVVGSVLAIGAVHPPVMLIVGALSATAFAGALVLLLGRQSAFPTLWPTVVLLALAGFTALQLIPLPVGWLGAIAPGNADVWQRALMPFGEPAPLAAPVSLDPGATWIEVVRWLSYAGVFTAAAVVASRRGARWGIFVVFVSAVIAALTTIGHGLAGANEVFGLYEPSFKPRPWHVGPLLNPNNLSGYLNLGLLCGLGLVLSEEPPLPRWLLAVGAAIVLGVNVTSASRGGLLVLPVALLALAITIEISRRRRPHSRPGVVRGRWLIGGAVVFGVVLALLAGTQQMWNELIDENVEKLQMLSWLKPMVGEFSWLGAGRGAFESVSPAFQPHMGSVVYTHAENFVMQWLIEWGIPVAVAALAALLWLFRPSRLGVGRSAVAASAWFGVMAVLAHNLLDLGLEIPGVVLGLAVVLGSLWGARRRRFESDPGQEVRPSAWVATVWVAGAGVACVVALVGGTLVGRRDLAADRELLQGQLMAQPAPRSAERREALRAGLREAMKRHPAEPYFPLLGGMLAWQERDQNPLPWLQRALERSLVNGKTHLLLAQVLMVRPVRSQALLELRLAVESDPTLTRHAARLALEWAQSLDELLATVPAGEGRAASLDALGRQAQDRERGAACDRLALEADPTLPGPHERLAQDLVAQRATEQGCGEDVDCQQQFDRHVAALLAADPRRSIALRLQARWLAASGDADHAEQLLAAQCEPFDDHDRCLQERAQIASEISDPERFAKAAQALMTAVCIDRTRCARVATWVGDRHSRRAEWGAAVTSYQRAVRDGETSGRLLKLATAAGKAGMHGQAVRALEQAKRLGGGEAGPNIDDKLREQRERAVAPLLGK